MLITRKNSHCHQQTGVSMIEVLVAIMILSVGLLGLAGLQSAGLTHNQSANSRSSASMLAYGLLDSMRANKVVAEGGAYDIGLGVTPAGGSTMTSQDTSQDVNNWLNELAMALPDGTGAIVTDASGKVTITIQWDDSRGVLPAQQFVMTTQL